LLERYQARLRRWAHGRLHPSARGAHETHDLVQDTLLQVLNNLDRFNPRHEGAFQGFVRTILANRIRDLARRWNRRGISDQIEGDELPGHGVSPLDEAIGSEIRARYEAALMRLRPEDRELIIARIELGLPYKEMVEMFNKPSVAAVTMAVSRAVVKLAQEMAHA
jgi:RNA polymerase sigma-70 factor (ECF subfamily)